MSTINANSSGILHTSDTSGDLNLQSSTGLVGVTGTGAVNLPSGTTAQRPASPTPGYTRINLTTNFLETYYDGAWKNLVNTANVDPTWVTPSGTLATITDAYSTYTNIATVQASDQDSGQTLSYAVTLGSLPSGTTLNSSTGVISGDPANVESSTTSTFTVTASDGAGGSVARSFSIIVNPAKDGTTAARAATSAQAIKTLTGTTTNGVYYIDLPTVGAQPIYCIMSDAFSGGGWMMAMKATRGGTFTYGANYWTTVNVLNETTQVNTTDADAKFHTMNYFQAKDIMAIWPDLGNGGDITGQTVGTIWLENNYYGGTRITPISFFSTVNNYNPNSRAVRGAQWNGGSQFSSQSGAQFYGFNFTANGSNQVRWGFGWNNEGDWGSNDVTGGIGVGRAGYSAGDAIYCCQDVTGFNRSARIEIYVR